MAGITTSAAVVARPVRSFLTHQATCSLAAGLILSTPVWPWLKQWGARMFATLPDPLASLAHITAAVVQLVAIAALLIISAAWLAGGTYNPFIYFRF
jgi:alginate O-acetyltransferase complex protein AlgI